ncbi:sensor histidine kinase [Amycolatopsis sp. cg9]|uniref:sensor histidine kinase n=1 Tax=Amycolatopsis sp. cg9 TaxID=3238801 RepID=UPI0035248948
MTHEGERAAGMWALAAVGAASALVAAVLVLTAPGMRNVPIVFALTLPFFVTGVVVWWRAPAHPLARRVLVTGTVVAMTGAVTNGALRLFPDDARASLWLLPWWAQIYVQCVGVMQCVVVVLVVSLVALVPDGRYRYPHERVALRAFWALPPLYLLNYFTGRPPPVAQLQLAIWLLLLVAAVLQAIRYARLPVTRQRSWRRLLGMGALIAGVSTAPLVLLRKWDISLRPPDPLVTGAALLALAVVATALLVAIVRYRLLGINLGVRWTTRYGMLWLLLGLWAVGIAGVIGTQLGTLLPAALAVIALVAAYAVRLSFELAARVAQIQCQAAELAASRTRIVHAQDSERRRIERDLHDGVQQELVALVAKLRLARNKLVGRAEQADVMLNEVQDDANRAIEGLRKLAHGIHPAELTDQGVVAAVRSRARRAPIPVTVTTEPPLESTRLPVDIEEAVFFLVSEALTNVLKHAGASRATVRFSLPGGSLLVEVTDDGAGLPPGHREGTGLIGLRDRVAAVGGELEVTPATTGGTTVRARLPAREVVHDVNA